VAAGIVLTRPWLAIGGRGWPRRSAISITTASRTSRASALVAWIVKRSSLSRRAIVIRLLFTATLALWLALGLRLRRLQTRAARRNLGNCPSVGHVNQIVAVNMALLALLTSAGAPMTRRHAGWRIYTGASADLLWRIAAGHRQPPLCSGLTVPRWCCLHASPSGRAELRCHGGARWRLALSVLAVVAGGFSSSVFDASGRRTLTRNKLLVTSSVAHAGSIGGLRSKVGTQARFSVAAPGEFFAR